MDSHVFEDLFDEANLLPDSSQVSLNCAAADLSFTNKHPEFSSSPGREAWMDRMTRPSLHQEDTDEFLEDSSNVDHDRHAGAGHTIGTDAVAQIERAFEKMTDELLNDKDEISITLKLRSSQARNHDHSSSSGSRLKRICFPGKSADEAWRFAVVVRILELMHEALRKDVVVSKRDIYYRDPALFGSQSHVDRYVDDIAFTFGLSRTALNVTAVAKGLVGGAFTIHRKDGSSINASADNEGILVPSTKDILSVDMKAVKWILVIEKEATFRAITGSAFWNVICTEGIILTAKGYPDLATRALLRLLSTETPTNGFASPAVYGLADFDPDGIAILSVYKNGSAALSHENEGHCVAHLVRLGLSSHHLALGQDNTHAMQGLLKLTARDRKKATRMLEKQQTDEESIYVKTQLQTMLMLDTKAELQLLDAVPGGMEDFLTAALGDI